MSDNDFLEEIKATEQEAEHIIEQSRAAARAKVEAARQEAADLLDRSRAQAEKYLAEKEEQADSQAREFVAKAGAAAEHEAGSLYDSVSKNIPDAVEKTAGRIVDLSVDR